MDRWVGGVCGCALVAEMECVRWFMIRRYRDSIAVMNHSTELRFISSEMAWLRLREGGKRVQFDTRKYPTLKL